MHLPPSRCLLHRCKHQCSRQRRHQALVAELTPGGSPRKVTFYQAGSSEMFGAVPPPQSERTPFYPRSPYWCHQSRGPLVGGQLPRRPGLFICDGILFKADRPYVRWSLESEAVLYAPSGAAIIIGDVPPNEALTVLRAARDRAR
jgi:hypothetical protein